MLRGISLLLYNCSNVIESKESFTFLLYINNLFYLNFIIVNFKFDFMCHYVVDVYC